jgi:hypothetical protein
MEGEGVNFRYRILLPLWGKKFTSRFTDFALPSQLAPGNLPSLPPDRASYHIFVPSSDHAQLRAAPSFQRLEQLLPTALEPIDDLYLGYAYRAMSLCYNRGMRLGRKQDTAFVFLTPDSLWSDGCFARMHELLLQGQRAVVLLGTRINLETALPTLSPVDSSLRLTGRQLVSVILEHMHPASKAYTWTPEGNCAPGHFQFAVGRDGLLARAAHLHPFVVRPVDSRARIRRGSTLDGHYLRSSCPDPATIHVVTDSDEMCVAEFSSAYHLDGFYSHNPIPMDDHIAFLAPCTDAQHRAYLRQYIRLHARDVTAEWGPVEQLSDGVVAEVCARLEEAQAKIPQQEERVHSSRLHTLLTSLTEPLATFSHTLVHRPWSSTRVTALPASVIGVGSGFRYVVDLGQLGIFSPSDAEFHLPGGTGEISRLALLEDDKPLGPPHQDGALVSSRGLGRYCHWQNMLHFSTSDNTDPRVNSRRYSIVVPVTLASMCRRLGWRARRSVLLRQTWRVGRGVARRAWRLLYRVSTGVLRQDAKKGA